MAEQIPSSQVWEEVEDQSRWSKARSQHPGAVLHEKEEGGLCARVCLEH